MATVITKNSDRKNKDQRGGKRHNDKKRGRNVIRENVKFSFKSECSVYERNIFLILLLVDNRLSNRKNASKKISKKGIKMI